jgi:hypothetical protein
MTEASMNDTPWQAMAAGAGDGRLHPDGQGSDRPGRPEHKPAPPALIRVDQVLEVAGESLGRVLADIRPYRSTLTLCRRRPGPQGQCRCAAGGKHHRTDADPRHQTCFDGCEARRVLPDRNPGPPANQRNIAVAPAPRPITSSSTSPAGRHLTGDEPNGMDVLLPSKLGR